MRKNILLPGLIALFSMVNSAVQTKPLLKILEEDDLINNSLNKKEVFIHFETEPNNSFNIRVGKKYLPNENITEHKSESLNAVYRIKNLNQFLAYGANELEIIVANSSSKTSKKINIDISSEKILIDGLEFELCKRAQNDYKNNAKYHKEIANKINELNKLVPKEYQVKQIAISYLSICECEDHIEKGGTSNAGMRDGKIWIGYGNLKREVFLRNAIEHEFGHIIYSSLNQWASFKIKADFEWTYFQIQRTNLALFDLFKDSNYSFEKNAGHPQDNASELFASAFMIRRNYFSEYQRHASKLSKEDKEFADDVMNAVEIAMKKQN